jgi:SsrA-binding protein
MPILTKNKKARFNYTILETLEAGLVLIGPEVKSIKQGQVSINEAFVTFHQNNALLTNMYISPYKFARYPADYDPTHHRRLLLHEKEIDYLRGKSLEKGLTIIPLSIYTKNHLVKVELGIAQGKHTYNKKEALKKKDLSRELQRFRKYGE